MINKNNLNLNNKSVLLNLFDNIQLTKIYKNEIKAFIINRFFNTHS